MKAIVSARFFVGFVLVGACLVLAGCATPKADSSPKDASAAKPPQSSGAAQLYLLASPHSRLYVEVDAVAGSVPSEATLNDLRGFLSRYCKKPGGIEVVRSDVIPLEAAKGIPPKALARKYLNGPSADPASPPAAFLYVLFYDGVLSSRIAGAETGHPGLRLAPRPHWQLKNPHTDVLPYPVIFMNTRYGPEFLETQLLRHEAGHALDLACRTNHASDFHCLDEKCLMFKALKMRLRISRLLLGRNPFEVNQQEICRRCADQLAGSLKQAPTGNLRFVGPVLVRSETHYHVLSLPHRVKVVLGDLTEQDCRDFEVATRAETPVRGGDDNEFRVDALVKDQVLDEPAKIRGLIDRAKADPFDPVRELAPRLGAAAAERLCARGQFAPAVELCRQAVESDPKDDLIYNLLAWTKATCADTSVRNGQEAVAIATKACELTKWKDWNELDTLAAAYAEAGDFKRAVEFEERALRTGKLTQSEQKDFQGRVELYRQGKPFREKR